MRCRAAALFVLALVLPGIAHADGSRIALPAERPVVVTADFELRDINEINDESETFGFTGVLTLSWHDPRQAFDPQTEGVSEKLYQGEYQFNEVFVGWYPQAVLVNEAGAFDKRGVVLRVGSDGTCTLIESVNATAKAHLDLRRYPYDRQRVHAVFELLGLSGDEAELRVDPEFDADEFTGPRVPQWTLTDYRLSSEARGTDSTLVVGLELQRKSLYILRLIILPVVVIVMLSWSVFWMDRSSLGDRMNVSFVGVLTVVAYLIVLIEIQPRISYFTLMNAFLNISFFIMCASVAINLRVSLLDREGRGIDGDRLDQRCRWLFPAIYFGLIAIAAGVMPLLPPP